MARFSMTEIAYLKGLIRMASGEWLDFPAQSLTIQTVPVGRRVQALLIKLPRHEIVVMTAPMKSEMDAVESLCDLAELKAFKKRGIPTTP